MIVGDEKAFSAIDLYNLMGVDVSSSDFTENDITDVVIC